MEISWNHCRDFTSFAKRARKNHSIKAMSYIWCYPVKPQPNGATNCLQTKISKPTGKKRTTFKAVCENISNSIISAAGAWEKLGKATFCFCLSDTHKYVCVTFEFGSCERCRRFFHCSTTNLLLRMRACLAVLTIRFDWIAIYRTIRVKLFGCPR